MTLHDVFYIKGENCIESPYQMKKKKSATAGDNYIITYLEAINVNLFKKKKKPCDNGNEVQMKTIKQEYYTMQTG